MKNIFFFGVILWITSKSVACDICGGSSLNGIGLYNLNTNRYLGLFYEFSNSSYSDKNENWSYMARNYRININTAWSFNQNFQVEMLIPYLLNYRDYKTATLQNNGFGDLQLGINYFVKLKNDSTNKLVFKINLSTEMPTGRFNPAFESYVFQNSSKSVDGIFRLAFVYQRQKLNIVTQSSYKKSLMEQINYQFGSSIRTELLIKYALNWGDKITILPLIGCNLEYKNYDIARGYFQHGTRWSSLLGTIGTQIAYQSFIFGFIFNTPFIYNNTEKGIALNNNKIIYSTLTF